MGAFGIQVSYKTAGNASRRFASEDNPFPVKIMSSATASASRSDTYTVPANGVTVDSTSAPKQNFALQVNQTGTVDAWNVVLETSLDGVTFATVLTHTQADGAGVTKYVTGKPALYYRSRLVSITLGAGTSVTATILGMQ